ncbi:MAG TPA: Eco57I restriction-modification methylase domain-containing protein, partial [Isosphaeraceae bacterium]
MAKTSSPAAQPLFPGIRVPALPASARPLFLPDLVRQAAQAKQIDAPRRDRARAAFRKWSDDLRAGVLHAQTETQVEQDFTKVLLAALGYTTSADVPTGSAWTMTPKWPVPGAGIVDVALGHFHGDEAGARTGRPLVMVELKGAGTDLDRKQARALSPVQQAWDYLSSSETAQWAIVSNFVEVRLYSRSRSKNHVHRVLLEGLDDPDAFAAFYAVFHADGLLGTGALTFTAARLLEETGARQEAVGEELYRFYAENRAALIRELQDRGVADLDRAIQAAQRLLDRILFIAFAEDRQLLPNRRTLEATAELRVPGMTPWNAFQYLFRAIDSGDEGTGIPPYDGNLFKPDPILDDLRFPLDGRRWPQVFKTIGGYDFQNEVTVDVLGRIFERSIPDIEEIKAKSLAQHEATLAGRRAPGRRKLHGIFYTDATIVEYLVAAALGPAWERQRALLIAELGPGDGLTDPPPAAFSRAMLAWLDGLTVRDPACGSGAFLIAAHGWFEEARCGLLADLQHAEPDAPECAGVLEDWRARSAPLILRNNLFGVDLAPESVEIAQLSLWIRTARPGRPLTDLSANVLCGNSVVADPAVDAHAFDWAARFPRVVERGGFDAVVGNPPYVRQERLGPIKPYLERAFPKSYHGMADLYVYFHELGLRLLKPGGRLAYVVTNKWMKAGYGEPLRRLFGAEAWVESVVDFGHARHFFPDADVFPCFLVARKPTDEPRPETARVCVIPREQVRLDDLATQIA